MGLRDLLQSLFTASNSTPASGPRPYRSPVQDLADEARARREAERARREEAERNRREAERTRAATAAPAPAPAPAPAVVPAAEPLSEDKQRAFQERVRQGLLRKVAESGGTMPLGELHDFSERRFFIAHRAFSNLMEELVAEGLLDFDSRENTATLTRSGRARVGT